MMIKKILLVDDEKEITDFLKEFFEARSYQVFTAANPEEARKLLEEVNPHVALFDIRMKSPRDGLELLEWTRQKKFKVKVIMVTAVENDDVIQEAMKLGADEYITKPLGLERLEGSVTEKINALLQDSLDESHA
jgi:DNA-binding response OmpR family regulator